MEIEKLARRVRRRSGRYKDLAKLSGISESWISKFGRGVICNPTVRTAVAIETALKDLERIEDMEEQ